MVFVSIIAMAKYEQQTTEKKVMMFNGSYLLFEI